MKHALHPSEKAAGLAAIAILALLCIPAWLLCRERVLFADTAYSFYNTIQEQEVLIEHYRYGSVITKLIPAIGSKYHVPLHYILQAYGISFNLFYLLTGYLLVFVCRQPRLAVVFACYNILFISDSFFCAETNLGIAWLLLLLGMLLRCGTNKTPFIVITLLFIPLAVLAVFSHFTILIPAVFLWVYLICDRENWPYTRGQTAYFTTLLALVVAAKFLTGKSSYDNQHLYGILHFSLLDIGLSFVVPETSRFFYRCLVNYWVAIPVLAWGLHQLVLNKRWVLAGWSAVSVLGYIILMGLTYSDEHSNIALFHIEQEWTSITVLVATPFAFAVLQHIKPKVVVMLLLTMGFIRLGYIIAAAPRFQERIRYQEAVLGKMREAGVHKLAIYLNKPLQEKLIQDWALPYESAMLSAMAGDKPLRTFCIANRDDTGKIAALQHTRGVWLFDIVVPSEAAKGPMVYDTSERYQFWENAEVGIITR